MSSNFKFGCVAYTHTSIFLCKPSLRVTLILVWTPLVTTGLALEALILRCDKSLLMKEEMILAFE